jgi:hypothetical protein
MRIPRREHPVAASVHAILARQPPGFEGQTSRRSGSKVARLGGLNLTGGLTAEHRNAIGQISATERVFRLTEGGATIALSSQFVAVSSGSVGGAQIVAAGVITVGLAGYPVFALLLGLSGVIRLVAVRLIPVSESWTSQTGIFIVPSAK